VETGYIEVDQGGDLQRLGFGPTTPGSPGAAPAARGGEDAIERSQLQALFADPTPLLREGTRVRPTPEGIRIVGVRPGTMAARFGLESGDVVQAVDGKPLTTPDAALELVGRLRTATSVSVQILRKGQTVTRVLRIL
jgi:S1-C subfamily serine protease